MYHYVRPLEESPYPGIKGLRVSEFRSQLDFICRHHHPVTVDEVVHSIRSGDPLPPGAALLTFDDGYSDHFTHVLPLLLEKRVQGAFFASVVPVTESALLDVNRVHFILAVCRDKHEVLREIDAHVVAARLEHDLRTPAEYRAIYGKPNRFDDAETNYVKRMLQIGLPPAVRAELAAALFRKYVTGDEAAFVRELYMDARQIADMQQLGMYVGAHGRTHQWLDSLSGPQQAAEIDASLAFLRAVGSPVDDFWVMCYPYGAWNRALLEELRARDCALGLTVESRVADLDADDPLLCPRLDTNDLPKRS